MGAQSHFTRLQQNEQTPRWSLVGRVAFRFCFVYLGLFCLTTQVLGDLFPIPTVYIPTLSTFWPMRQITLWAATHVFRVTHPLVYADTGSGDKTFDWVGVFCLLVFAILAMGIWSILDRRRKNYVTLQKWFRLFIRFALAAEMISYGLSKAIPLQMNFPFLTRWVEPFGNFSPMAVLWNSIGASPAYEIFTGCAETLGGILLFVPRTTMLGSLICLADLVQVLTLNMTYDVAAKLLSFHLILLASYLLAPDFQRLVDFFLMNRAATPSGEPQLLPTPRADRLALAFQIIFGILIIGMNTYSSWTGWYAYGGGRDKSPFYGIWNVDTFSVDGQLRSPLLTDYGRWRRAIFDFPTGVNFERMDDSIVGYSSSINLDSGTITLTTATDKNWRATFSFVRQAPDELTLDGDMNNHKVHMQLQLIDRDKFLLVNRGFHWITEYPFNRVENPR